MDQVCIGDGTEKPIVNRKVWASPDRKQALQQIIFDGSKLAWYVLLYLLWHHLSTY